MRHWIQGLLLVVIFGTVPFEQADAERAWVKDEVRLNIRTGAGTGFRITGALKTGDELRVLQRAEKWTQIRSNEGNQGWIPSGYLQSAPPAMVRVVELEAQVIDLSERLNAAETELGKLQSSHSELTALEGEHKTEIDQLTSENRQLKSGQDIPLLITGASIFVGGMLCLSFLRWAFQSRSQPRIRI